MQHRPGRQSFNGYAITPRAVRPTPAGRLTMRHLTLFVKCAFFNVTDGYPMRVARDAQSAPDVNHLDLSTWRTQFAHEIVGDSADVVEALETRSEEHTSELQSRLHLVCRL